MFIYDFNCGLNEISFNFIYTVLYLYNYIIILW